MKRLVFLAFAILSAAVLETAAEETSGRQQLPCEIETLLSQHPFFCQSGRNYVLNEFVPVIEAWARSYYEQTNTPLVYLDGSGATPKRLWPHRSHGSGHQLDIAFPYLKTDGAALARAPFDLGYGSYEPPRLGETVSCAGVARPFDLGDPKEDRGWQLDDERLRAMLRIILEDPRMKRIFLEPHLTKRLGFEGHPKIGFAGCSAARHDDHIHVIFE
ncbi:MAG: hypothetical protein AAGF20_12955 [Pseudomonadota bacterium]